ncbi:NAD+ synthase (glutamine-hydrolyzing) [Bifidobacterium commune]|uniref:Glutamine-dependent NAD(+) synthetase n=1 Tax=Bifidobacterium commune TaxID=1505727 RepID=A0A1C4H0I9_9BIFI|nr:NAD+ synthase [Bifidobacterium commune]MBB2954622.1 NAD+ synthase (glutamine-hydrolyzing) [Bifidobacterium commune]SCC78421.1 NAD+ synthase (glutamine-hydrolysing) [Bifidobacterium commune]
MTQLRFALAQIDTCVGDLEGNASTVLRYARMAALKGARVVVFPEMTLTGYPIEDLALRATFRKAAADKANELAQALKKEGLGELYVVVGTVGTSSATDVDGKPTNRLVVLHSGSVSSTYDKHFLPNYGVFDEFRIFEAGERSVVLDIDGVKIGVAICEDIWQDGGPVAQLAGQGIDVLLTINGSPYEEGKTHTRFDLAKRRALEVNAPVIYLNQVGGQDDLVFDGGSFVVDSDGTLIERSPMFVEDLSYFDFDPDMEHQTVGSVADRRDPDEEIYTACVLGLKDYMTKNHFGGVVLGLSGGIDSALVAAMAADAVGGENVQGVSMPSMYSSDGSKDDAAELAENIGAHYDIQPIEPLFQAFQSQLGLDGIAAENLQARIRGVIVMAYSNSKKLLALATGNKSELACGYSTIYGDAVGGYAPIKDLLKTRVWELSRWRNKAAAEGIGVGGLCIVGNEGGKAGTPLTNGVMIPISSIEKSPSAELRPGQKDSDSLPEYELLDKVLAAYIEKAHGRASLLRDGFDEETVNTVIRLVDGAEWKRRQYPLGPKVTSLAFGRDRRLPITSAFTD